MLRRRSLVWLALVSFLVSGCVIPDYGRPLAPAPGYYVVNRDGEYYVGLRCTQDLTGVAVAREGAVSIDQNWPRPDQVLWEAKAEPPGVGEFHLFGSAQTGVAITHQGAVPKDAGNPVQLFLKNLQGDLYRPLFVLAEISPGNVAGGRTLGTWEEYKNLPDSNFECVADWSGRG